MRKPLLFSVLLGSTLATACTPTTSDRDLVYRRPDEVVMLAAETKGAFRKEPIKVLWLDPRTTAEFEKGHIPQATSLPFPEIEKKHEVACKGFDAYIVYDTDYDDVMAKAAAKRLLELGYTKVYCILGGLKAWQADGNPVATGKP
jgi:rhodanese-related sulfurtransferase